MRSNKEVADLIRKGNRSILVYNDGVWSISTDTSSTGNTRIWVSYEYRDGKCDSAVSGYYKADNGSLRYYGLSNIPKKVDAKLKSLCIYLDKEGLRKI